MAASTTAATTTNVPESVLDAHSSQEQHAAQDMHSPATSELGDAKSIEASPQDNALAREATAEPGEDGTLATEKTVTRATTASVEPVYPHGLKLATITVALMLTILCVALDNTIIATAIPKITDDFDSLNDVGWYASSYLLTNCTFQLLFGRLYTIFPLKTVFLIGLAIFEIGSLVCGAAPNSAALIVGRAVAGLGAGGLFSGSLIIVASAVPLQKRPTYIGTITSMFGLASVIGPLMGGAFTDRVTWRLCFYINLPLGLVTAVGIFFFFQSPPRHQQRADGLVKQLWQLDPIGNLAFLPSVVCLLLALQWGGTTYPWSDGRIIALFVVFGVLLLTWIGVQIKGGENATVPVRIVRSSRSIPFSMLWGFCIGSSFFIFVYFVPIWFQAVHGVSATQSGINTLPFLLAQVFGAISSGIFVTRVGYYTPALFMSVIFSSIGAGLLTTLTPDTPTAHWIGYQIIYGLGTGFGFQQAVIVVQTILPNRDIPIGTALLLFLQILGGSVFVSVGENLFTNRLVANMESVLPAQLIPEIVGAGATAFYNIVPPKYLTVAVQAYNGAITHTFLVGLVMSCITIIAACGIEIRNVKVAKQKKAPAPVDPVEVMPPAADVPTGAGAAAEMPTAESEKTETV